jgi:hypothetical protein
MGRGDRGVGGEIRVSVEKQLVYEATEGLVGARRYMTRCRWQRE